MTTRRQIRLLTCAVLATALGIALPSAAEEESSDLPQWLGETHPVVDLRLRYEGVDQADIPEDATAETLRARLGFETGKLWNLSLLAEAEVIRAFDDDYNSTLNGNTQFPVVADEETEEVNRLQITSTGISGTTLIIGRQRLIYDDHRFVGNSGWRQNEQTFDALRVIQRSVEHLTVDLGYVNQVNRVFGRESPVGRYTGDNWLANVAWDFPSGKLTGFTYLLDLDESPLDSTGTTGFRLTHKWTRDDVVFSTLLSAARQADRAGNPLDYRSDYVAADLTVTVHAWSVSGGIDLLEGDGVRGFSAPIGTLHRFQGWADKFLTTPPDGIDDRYVGLAYAKKSVAGMDSLGLQAVYHDFDAEHTSASQGSELDLQLQGVWKRFVGALTCAIYDADTFATDTTKVWLQFEFLY